MPKGVVITTTNDVTTRHLRKVNVVTAAVTGTSLPEWTSVTDDNRNTFEKVVSMSPALTGAKTVVVPNATPALTYPLDGLSPTAAFSMSRDLRTAFIGGTRYTVVTGVATWTDQTGNLRVIQQASTPNQPLVATAGPNSRTCMDSDGVNDAPRTTGAVVSSNFIASSAAYIVISFIADAFDSNNATIYLNDALFGDSGRNFGMFVKTGGVLWFYNNDGSQDVVSTPIVAGTAYVVEWRHDTGVGYMRVNKGTEVSVATGNTADLSTALCLCTVQNSPVAGDTFDGKIFEFVTFNTVPALAVRDALVTDMMTWIGAV